MSVTVTGPIRKKYSNDPYGTHFANEGVGGPFYKATTSERDLIPVQQRVPYCLCIVWNYGGNPTVFWLEATNDTASLSNNNNWKVAPLGAATSGGTLYKGSFSATTGLTGTGLQILDQGPLPVGSLNGHFYICSEGGTIDFGQGSQTFNVQDWIIWDGVRWRKQAQAGITGWASITGKPAIIENIGNGSFVPVELPPFTALSGRVTTLENNQKVFATEQEALLGASTEKLMSPYTTLRSILVNAVGIQVTAVLPAGYEVKAGKYFEYNGTIFRCINTHVLQSQGQFIHDYYQYVGLPDSPAGKLFGRFNMTWQEVVGSLVELTSTGFNGNLDQSVTNVQLLANRVDQLTGLGGGTGGGSEAFTYSWVANLNQTQFNIPGAAENTIQKLVFLSVAGVPQRVISNNVTINGNGTGIVIVPGTDTINSGDEIIIIYTKGAVSGEGTVIGGPAVENNYPTINDMLAGQAAQEQTTGSIQHVVDATQDPTVTQGWADYIYLGTTNGNLTDYRKQAEQESMDKGDIIDRTIYGDDVTFITLRNKTITE